MTLGKHENETFAQRKARKERGQRGKSSEEQVREVLSELKRDFTVFDFDRIYDTRSAGRPLPPAVSDFTIFCDGVAYSLEVKEVKKGQRLKKFVQLPRMIRRHSAGVSGNVLVHLLEPKVWVLVPLAWFLESGADAASWDLTYLTKYPSAKQALEGLWLL